MRRAATPPPSSIRILPFPRFILFPPFNRHLPISKSCFHPFHFPTLAHTSTSRPLTSSTFLSFASSPVSHSPPFSSVPSSSLLPLLQRCVAALRGTLCCPQPLSAVLRVLPLWLRLFLSTTTTTTTLYYPPSLTSWQVHSLCTACLETFSLSVTD